LASVKAYQYIASGGLQELGKSLLSNISLTRKAATANVEMGNAAKAGGEGVKTAGRAMNAIPWMLLISLVVELATAWYDVASGAAEARRQQDMYDKAKQDGQAQSEDIQDATRKAHEEQMFQLDQEIRRRIANGEDEKKLSKERAQREKEIAKNTKKSFDDQISAAEKLKDTLTAQVTSVPEKVMQLSRSKEGGYVEVANPARQNEQFRALEQQLATTFQTVENLKKAQGEFDKQLIESETKLLETDAAAKDYTVTIADNKGKLDKNIDTQKKFQTELEKTQRYISKSKQLMQELNEVQSAKAVTAQQGKVDSAINNLMAKLSNPKKDGGIVVDLGDVADDLADQFDAIEKLIIEKAELQKKSDKEATDFAISEARRKADEENKLALEKLEQDKKDKLAQEGLKAGSPEEKAILDDYAKKLEEVNADNASRTADAEAEVVIIKEKSAQKQLDIENQKNDEINKYNDDLNAKLQENANKYNEQQQENADKFTEQQLETYDAINEAVKFSADLFIRQSQRKVEALDKEIDMAQKTYEHLQTLAENGNIAASQSLAEQQKIITEKERQRAKQLKRQERIKLAQSVYETYNSKLQAGSQNPLGETIRDATLLSQFIASLPSFEKGTEDTGINGKGVDGKGGKLSILHPHERVVPKHINEKLNGISNEELGKLAINYQNRIVQSAENLSEQPQLLISKLDELNDTIKNKPVTNIELGEITTSMMEIVQSTKKNHTVVYNRYKIRK